MQRHYVSESAGQRTDVDTNSGISQNKSILKIIHIHACALKPLLAVRSTVASTRKIIFAIKLQCPLECRADCTDIPIAMHTAMHSITATHHVPTHDEHCDELIAPCHRYAICWQCSLMCQMRCMVAVVNELQRCVRCIICYVASACCSQYDALVIVYLLVDIQHFVMCNFECVFFAFHLPP